MARRLLVVADRPDGEVGDRDLVALLSWLDGQGWSARLMVWDRADLGSRLGRRPTTEIEAINRWRLPQRLERVGWRGAMRRLRHLRVRWWWLRQRAVRTVLLWGPVRPEVRHYLPPRRPVVAVELDPAPVVRGTDGPSAACAEELADRRVVLRRRGPAACTPGSPLLVGSWGPSAVRPLVGAEVLLRLVWTLRQRRPDLDVRARWAGGDARSPAWFPTTWERGRLGLEAVVALVPERAVGSALADDTAVVALVGPEPTRQWPTDRVHLAGVPIVGFTPVAAPGELPAVLELRRTAWPDVRALADEVAAELDEVRSVRAEVEGLPAVLAGS